MKTAIIGLGLIGGSIAKAYKASSDSLVYGYDKDASTLGYAKLSETIDDELTDEILGECDLIFIALYPDIAVKYLREKAPLFSKDSLVIDTCGIKREICKVGFEMAAKYGFTFVGGHPMAGVQFSGIKYSRADMFKGASMVIVPPSFDDIALLERVKTALRPLDIGKMTVSTAENHDRIIAFTSQLAHIVSSSYIKSPTASEHDGFSAGSYRDMTRVATLNEDMWTSLFMQNRENLIFEIDSIIGSLSEYKTALERGDEEGLRSLLRSGTERKSKIDG